MKYQAAEYLPGDRIYIFSHLRHKQGSGTFEIARVVRVTPTGQLVAKVAESGLERRFNPEGQEFGDWGIWSGSPWVTDKDSALERALQIRRESAERKLRKDVQTELASLTNLNPSCPEGRAHLIVRLRALADKVESTP